MEKPIGELANWWGGEVVSILIMSWIDAKFEL